MVLWKTYRLRLCLISERRRVESLQILLSIVLIQDLLALVVLVEHVVCASIWRLVEVREVASLILIIWYTKLCEIDGILLVFVHGLQRLIFPHGILIVLQDGCCRFLLLIHFINGYVLFLPLLVIVGIALIVFVVLIVDEIRLAVVVPQLRHFKVLILITLSHYSHHFYVFALLGLDHVGGFLVEHEVRVRLGLLLLFDFDEAHVVRGGLVRLREVRHLIHALHIRRLIDPICIKILALFECGRLSCSLIMRILISLIGLVESQGLHGMLTHGHLVQELLIDGPVLLLHNFVVNHALQLLLLLILSEVRVVVVAHCFKSGFRTAESCRDQLEVLTNLILALSSSEILGVSRC